LELNVRPGELRNEQGSTRLGEHSLRVLLTLLEHPVKSLGARTLARNLRPDETFVDFEDGLNHAIKKLREAPFEFTVINAAGGQKTPAAGPEASRGVRNRVGSAVISARRRAARPA
jgi:hypothetical protein